MRSYKILLRGSGASQILQNDATLEPLGPSGDGMLRRCEPARNKPLTLFSKLIRLRARTQPCGASEDPRTALSRRPHQGILSPSRQRCDLSSCFLCFCVHLQPFTPLDSGSHRNSNLQTGAPAHGDVSFVSGCGDATGSSRCSES